MNIYTQNYHPFFYIIQDAVNGIYYAGSKWAANATPDTFMTKSGYKTSSKVIKSLIKEHGLDRFIIRKIKKFENEKDTRVYETRFLRKVNAKYNSKFYNESNGDGSINIEKAKDTWVKKYGVDSPLKSDEIQNKIKKTNLEKYGVERPLASANIREKVRATSMERYDAYTPLENVEVREKIKQTNLSKYGVDNPLKSKNIQNKIKETIIARYGVDNISKNPEIKEKMSRSAKERFKNIENHPNFGKELSEETKQKLREANLGKTHTEESKMKMSETRSEKVWIKKEGQKSKHVHHSEADIYISEGWSLGRTLGKQKKKRAAYDSEYKIKMSQSLSEKIWISKSNETPKFINKKELETFINDGWIRGRKYL